MSQGVVFRRIGGRIVPIRNAAYKKQEIKQGAVEIVAGGAAAATAGVVAAKTLKSAQHLARKSKDEYRVVKQNFRAAASGMGNMQLKTRHTSRALRKAVGTRLAARQLFRSRNAVLNAGALVGAALIGHGVSKVHDALSQNRKNNSNIVGAGAGIAAGAIAGAVYYKSQGFSTGKALVNTYARLKGIRRPHQKYGKSEI